MRTIKKHAPPSSLVQWRASRMTAQRPAGMDCTYEEMRRDPDALEAVEDGLIAEQGGICAYTGLRIAIRSAGCPPAMVRDVDFHVEHLRPQAYCTYGQDAEYGNLVACWPKPNCRIEPKYGARKKGSWPSLTQENLFVSPLRHDCSARFAFNHRGEITANTSSDLGATETIERLGLNHDELTELRKRAIEGALHPGGRRIGLAEARRLCLQLDNDSRALDQGSNVRLEPFCFAIRQALEHEIHKLEGIMRRR